MIRKFIIILLIILVFIFVFQNTQLVEVKFFFWIISIPRALMLFSTLAVGLICGWLLPGRRKKQVVSNKENKKIGG
jgi:uncharacterized integral membrane protein